MKFSLIFILLIFVVIAHAQTNESSSDVSEDGLNRGFFRDLFRRPVKRVLKFFGFMKRLLRFRNRSEAVDMDEIEARIKTYSNGDVLDDSVTDLARNTIVATKKTFPKLVQLNRDLDDLYEITNRIDFLYDQFQSYLNDDGLPQKLNNRNGNDNVNDLSGLEETISELGAERDENVKLNILEHYTKLDYASWIVGNSYYSSKALLERLNDLVLGKNGEIGILQKILSAYWESNPWPCNVPSVHQTLYNLYKGIEMTELKGQRILLFSYQMLQGVDESLYYKLTSNSMEQYKEVAKLKANQTSQLLTKNEAIRSIHRCDPETYKEGVTHTRLTGFIRGYIENQMSFDSTGACKRTCSDVNYYTYRGCTDNKLCSMQNPCTGTIYGCEYVKSPLEVCLSKSRDRHYDWVKQSGKTIYGAKNTCSGKTAKIQYWRKWFFPCYYCTCYCDDRSAGGYRHFSLKSVTSDIKKNMVVTGIRIVRQRSVIHLQIQQGVLNPEAVVNKTTQSWKPVESFSINNDSLKEGEHYYSMNAWKRSMDLNIPVAPPGYVVTGVRFRGGDRLYHEIRITAMNFETGELNIKENSTWIGQSTEEAKSKKYELRLTEPDLPTKYNYHNYDNNQNQYLMFQTTSFESDVAQTIVPYLDSQTVTSGGFAISGVGFIHRGIPYSGGFVAPLIVSYNFSQALVDHLYNMTTA